MPTRSGTAKPVRPILAGSLSVGVRDLTSSSTESERKLRRHSVATDDGSKDPKGDATGTLKPDGSLRKVSRWFRDFKMKMDPIKVKDRIRYSRPSLDRQANVNDEEEEVNGFRRHGKTATMGTRRSGRKQLEKRFNSMENLPGTEVLRPQNIRKMKSFQFDVNDDELEADSTLQADFLTELTQRDAESLDGMTESISLKLNEKERLFNEILQPSSQNQLRESQTSDVKLSVLASESLVTELTQLINVSIQPGNLHLKQQEFHQHQQQPEEHQLQPLQPTTTTTMMSTTAPESEIILKNPVVCLYIDDSSKFVDVLGRLQSQLSMLLVALDENSVKVNCLKMKIGSVKSSTVAEIDQSLLPLPDPNSPTSRQEKTFRRSSSLSDAECFLSLINDLGDSPDVNEYTTI